jgi:phage recombination protein Bet
MKPDVSGRIRHIISMSKIISIFGHVTCKETNVMKSEPSETVINTTSSEDWSPEEARMIRETVAKDATPEELRLFLYTAKARGLNPLLKQIYFIKRKQRRGDRWIETGVIQTGVDGFRLIANRTRKLRGIERGLKRDENGKLYAWAKIWRKDWESPAYEEVSLEEYRADTPLWNRMPEQMLKKCAEVAALRMAFPEDLSGLYAHEEMDQADKSDTTDRGSIQAAVLSTQEALEMKEAQKAMRDCLKTIISLQKEHGLTKEEIQWITGLETFKGVELPVLEKAADAIIAHCTEAKTLQEVR